MKVVSARDFELKRENDYGTPEQNEVVKAIVRIFGPKEMPPCCGIPSNWTVSV